jgi:ketosteroid isomerase-like protein
MADRQGDVVSAATLVADLFQIIDDGRWEDLGLVLADDCVVHPAQAGPLVGLARVERYYRHERPIVSGRHRLGTVVGDDDTAACWGTFTGRTAHGEDITAAVAEAFVLRAGKIVWRTSYVHTGQILPPPATGSV